MKESIVVPPFSVLCCLPITSRATAIVRVMGNKQSLETLDLNGTLSVQYDITIYIIISPVYVIPCK